MILLLPQRPTIFLPTAGSLIQSLAWTLRRKKNTVTRATVVSPMAANPMEVRQLEAQLLGVQQPVDLVQDSVLEELAEVVAAADQVEPEVAVAAEQVEPEAVAAVQAEAVSEDSVPDLEVANAQAQ